MTTHLIDRVVRSERKSISVSVNQDAQVVVRAPNRMPERDIEMFVAMKNDWIQVHLQRVKDSLDARIDLASCTALPFRGSPLAIRQQGDELKLCRREGELKLPALADRKMTLTTLLKREARTYFQQRLDCFSRKTGIGYGSLRLSSAKKRWGSCTSEGVIRINWKLIFCEDSLIDYVIAHELAHMVEANHSSRFYAVLKGILPDYRERETRLDECENFLLVQ